MNSLFSNSGYPSFNYLILFMIGLTFQLSACSKPGVKTYPYKVSHWAPTQPVTYSSNPQAIKSHHAFKTIHSDFAASDEIDLIFAPTFAASWTVENKLFTPTGPTFDQFGNIYFSPLNPVEPVYLVSLDPATGKRRWALVGREPGIAGSPLILPAHAFPNKIHNKADETDIIYVASSKNLTSVLSTGELLWQVPFQSTSNSALNFGVNFLRVSNLLISLNSSGEIFLHSPTSGELIHTYQLPGSPAAKQERTDMPDYIKTNMKNLFSEFFHTNNIQNIENSLAVLLGQGVVAANFFAVGYNPQTQSDVIWIAATAPDEVDGEKDNTSSYGAIYKLSLHSKPDESPDKGITIKEDCRFDFPGGTASTPALSADNKTIYIGDGENTVYAIDEHCQARWSYAVDEQIIGSIAVSKDNNEVYVSTKKSIFKLISHDKKATLDWRANTEVFQGRLLRHTQNMQIAAIAANGVMVQVGNGLHIGNQLLPDQFAMVLLDKTTGLPRFATTAVEESVAVISTNNDGVVYLGNSPVRHAIKAAIFNQDIELIGGITKYASSDANYFINDGLCAINKRLLNINQTSSQQNANTITLEKQILLALYEQSQQKRVETRPQEEQLKQLILNHQWDKAQVTAKDLCKTY